MGESDGIDRRWTSRAEVRPFDLNQPPFTPCSSAVVPGPTPSRQDDRTHSHLLISLLVRCSLSLHQDGCYSSLHMTDNALLAFDFDLATPNDPSAWLIPEFDDGK